MMLHDIKDPYSAEFFQKLDTNHPTLNIGMEQQPLYAGDDTLIISGKVKFDIEGHVQRCNKRIQIKRYHRVQFENPFRSPPAVTASLIVGGELKLNESSFDLVIRKVKHTGLDICTAVPVEDLHCDITVSWLAIGRYFTSPPMLQDMHKVYPPITPV